LTGPPVLRLSAFCENFRSANFLRRIEKNSHFCADFCRSAQKTGRVLRPVLLYRFTQNKHMQKPNTNAAAQAAISRNTIIVLRPVLLSYYKPLYSIYVLHQKGLDLDDLFLLRTDRIEPMQICHQTQVSFAMLEMYSRKTGMVLFLFPPRFYRHLAISGMKARPYTLSHSNPHFPTSTYH
jgi:hypothetical protein